MFLKGLANLFVTVQHVHHLGADMYAEERAVFFPEMTQVSPGVLYPEIR